MAHEHGDGRMAHYKDLRELYAKSLEYHGIGYALYQPVAAADLTPPCAGFFDRNGNFNMIAKLSASQDGSGFVPLEYMPHRQAEIGIEWKPKTSLGVLAVTVDSVGEGPNIGVPASASAHVKYSSKSSFGAVVIASKPVTMTGYNDERLFLAWLAANKDALAHSHGTQLRRYGMWIVTQTHTAPSCWINAWQDKSREAIVSLKAKANMMGELGQELDLDDQSSDRDWTHYSAKDGAGVVVFMDGIEVKPVDWYVEGFKQTVGLSRSTSRSRKPSPGAAVSITPQQPLAAPSISAPIDQHEMMRSLSTSPPSAAAAARRASYTYSQFPSQSQAQPLSHHQPQSPSQSPSPSRSPSHSHRRSQSQAENAADRSLSSWPRQSSLSVPQHIHANTQHTLATDQYNLVTAQHTHATDQHTQVTTHLEAPSNPQSPTEEQTLRDIGITHSLSRSLSTVSHSSSPRTPSLRREVRNISPRGAKHRSWNEIEFD